jgi:hypothetical protein
VLVHQNHGCCRSLPEQALRAMHQLHQRRAHALLLLLLLLLGLLLLL